jgi:hypothetical protein
VIFNNSNLLLLAAFNFALTKLDLQLYLEFKLKLPPTTPKELKKHAKDERKGAFSRLPRDEKVR